MQTASSLFIGNRMMRTSERTLCQEGCMIVDLPCHRMYLGCFERLLKGKRRNYRGEFFLPALFCLLREVQLC